MLLRVIIFSYLRLKISIQVSCMLFVHLFLLRTNKNACDFNSVRNKQNAKIKQILYVLPSSLCYILNDIYLCTQHKTVQFVCKLCRGGVACLLSFNLLFIFNEHRSTIFAFRVFIHNFYECKMHCKWLHRLKIATTSFCLSFKWKQNRAGNFIVQK